ncbi:hypothetical protein CYMTET_8195 [Cymbomonas tetramitiformis]|uniref:Cytochrome c-type biogenesis protein H TPR domain-containing protein n=1 Tax=Cymbomonas tetramitiformis TaxID=36881 RepID=A0AAE0GU61_9CHLO|nr:hypothetical protein CYMTET_8195 [Cymbomonas tetramitiformis]
MTPPVSILPFSRKGSSNSVPTSFACYEASRAQRGARRAFQLTSNKGNSKQGISPGGVCRLVFGLRSTRTPLAWESRNREGTPESCLLSAAALGNAVDDAEPAESQARKYKSSSTEELTPMSPREILRKVKWYQRRGDVHAARDLLQLAVKEYPGNLFLLTTVGRLEAKARRFDDAGRYFEQAMACGGDESAVTIQAYALLAAEQGDLDKARELFSQAVQVDEVHAPAWQAWAVFERSQKNLPQAGSLFQRAHKADPSHVPTIQAWALLRVEEGDTKGARKLFELAVATEETHMPSWQAWAEMEWAAGDQGKARHLYKKAEGIKSIKGRQRSILMTSWACAEASVARFDVSARLALAATKGYPRNEHAWLALARAREARGEKQRAFKALKEALEVSPHNVHLQHAQAMLSQRSGDADAAEAQLRRLLKDHPRNAHAWHALGTMALTERQDPAEALRCFQQGAREGEEGTARAKCYGSWANEVAISGGTGKARELYQRGDQCHDNLFRRADANPNDSRTWLQWGLWERSQGMPQQARRCFEKGVMALPSSYFCFHSWALLEVAMHNTDRAREIFRRGTLQCKGVDAAPLWMEYACFEAEEGDLPRARELFKAGSQIAPGYAPLFEAWAQMEAQYGDGLERASQDMLSSLNASEGTGIPF